MSRARHQFRPLISNEEMMLGNDNFIWNQFKQAYINFNLARAGLMDALDCVYASQRKTVIDEPFVIIAELLMSKIEETMHEPFDNIL